MIEKAADFIKENIDKNILLIFDTDGDGIGSAVIMTKTLKKAFNKNIDSVPANHGLFFTTKNLIEEVERKKIDVVITVDLAVDENPRYILELAKKAKVLIIDHHQIHKNLNKAKNILHINPDLWKCKIPSYKYCASKLVYDVCSKITNIEELDWLAGIGIVNDKCEDRWKGFLKKIYRRYKLSQTKLTLINDIISSGYFNYGIKGIRMGYNACLESSSPLDILKARTKNSKKLKILYNEVEIEIASSIKDWKKNAEIFNDKKLIILKLKTKSAINSPISTKISFEKPNYTVVVARRKGKFIYMSLRRQDKKVNCGEIATMAVKNLKESNGGGHIPASGAHILNKDWNAFRENLLKLT